METHRVHGLSVELEAGGRAILAIAAVDQSALRTRISIAGLEKTREESARERAYRVARIVEGVASAENAAGIELRRAPSSWREGVSWLAKVRMNPCEPGWRPVLRHVSAWSLSLTSFAKSDAVCVDGEVLESVVLRRSERQRRERDEGDVLAHGG